MSKKLLIIILMLTVMLTGCFPSGELKTSSEPAANSTTNVTPSDNSDNSEPDAPKELEHVKFNIEPYGEYPAEAPVIKTKRAVFDVEEMKALFIAGKDIIHEQTGDDVNNFDTSDGAWLSVRKDGITYVPDEHRYDGDTEKKNISRMQQNAATYALSYSKSFPNINIELEGFPRYEAIERANELVKTVGVKFLGEPTVYTFTAEDIHNFDKKITLSKEDEFYLVIYPTAYGDIPVSWWSTKENYASKVEIILTKEKLVKLDCEDVFDNIEVIDTVQIKCGAENALSRLYDYYRIDETPQFRFEYDGLDITYITDSYDTKNGVFTYRPLWCASGTMYDMDGQMMANNCDKFIDPATGFVFE